MSRVVFFLASTMTVTVHYIHICQGRRNPAEVHHIHICQGWRKPEVHYILIYVKVGRNLRFPTYISAKGREKLRSLYTSMSRSEGPLSKGGGILRFTTYFTPRAEELGGSLHIYIKGGGTLQLDSKAKELPRSQHTVYAKGGGTLRFPTYMPKAKELLRFPTYMSRADES
jgi:hypothetical protein